MSGRPDSHYGRGRGSGRGSDRGRGIPFHGPPGGGSGRGRGGGPEPSVFTHRAGDVPQLDQQVEKIENESEKAGQLLRRSGSGGPPAASPFPQRPGYGTQGKRITLWANYFRLVTRTDLILYRYGAEILPGESGKAPVGKKAKRIIQLLIEEHFAQYASSIATDYKSTLISRVALPIGSDPYLIRYRFEEEDQPSPNAKTFTIRLQETGTLRISDLLDQLTSTRASSLLGTKEGIIQALNIIVGAYPKAAAPNTVSIGANKHFEMAPNSEKISLQGGLEAVRGFFVSVRAATARILVNVQVKHAAFYMEGSLVDLMRAYADANGQAPSKLAKFLNKLRVRVTHIKRTNKDGREIPRIKTIMGFATQGDGRGLPHPPKIRGFGAGSHDVKFFVGDSEQSQTSEATTGKKGKKPVKQGPNPPSDGYISVYDHFLRRYNITIPNPRMPVVNVGTHENPSFLPPDVCVVVRGQPSGAKLSPTQTQKMIGFAVRGPAQNAQSIVVNGARVLGIQPFTSTILHDCGIDITPRLIAVPGRILTGPDVNYKNGSASVRGGGWNMSQKPQKLSSTATISSWTYLHILSQQPQARDPWQNHPVGLGATLNIFQTKLRNLGLQVADFTQGMSIQLNDGNKDDPTKDSQNEKLIENTISLFANSSKRRPPQFLLVIMPYVDDPVYNKLKQVCDLKHGLRNVCVIASKFAKETGSDQYFSNVALKVNLKFGGRNQHLHSSKLGILAEGKTMVVGMDVTHPSPGSSSKAPSVAGMVASVDKWLGQWPADLRIQTARVEMVAEIDSMLKSRLQLWALKNQNHYPENILIYRDGVSEGQYNLVLDHELPLLRKACAETYPANVTKQGLPRLTIIIVGKRHHTRFYPTNPKDADKSLNPPNGTVVDRGVTEAPHWDFFMQAHTALKGTARPAHYYVILDEIFNAHPVNQPFRHAADVLEDLTHNMCYLFGRATRAVSICPPAYYADLVCERARKYLGRLFDATPAGSVAGSVAEGGAGAGGQGPDQSEVLLHPNVRDSMFYI